MEPLEPPAPPPASLLKPDFVPHVPLTPMMDFMARRLEALEKDLAIERERAQSAQALIQHQESLRAQVEQQLKSMSESFRREKAERDGEETKQHARGRIDALEKRLDEMHQSWVTLLRDAMTQRETTHTVMTSSQDTIAREQAGLKADLAAVQGAVNDLVERMTQWQSQTQPMADAAPQVLQHLADLSLELTKSRDRAAAWERQQALERESHEQRLLNFSREKAALLRELEERDHALRQESLKEKLHREATIGEQIGALAKRVEDLTAAHEKSQTALSRLHEHVMTPPKAKDLAIQALEAEKLELVLALKARQESLQDHLQQRREVERTLGESLMALNRELDDSKGKAQLLSAKISQLEREQARLCDELASSQRQAQDKDERRAALEAERDQITKALMVEAEKSRALIEERSRSDESWAKRLCALQAQFAAEVESKTHEASTVADLRGQLATLSEHLARALKERDAAAGSHGSWEQERATLLRRLEEKEKLISSLNATFQRLLRPEDRPLK